MSQNKTNVTINPYIQLQGSTSYVISESTSLLFLFVYGCLLAIISAESVPRPTKYIFNYSLEAEQQQFSAHLRSAQKCFENSTPVIRQNHKGIRRDEPPFSKFLQNDQKRELQRKIKEAKREGATRQDVQRRIDHFLQDNVDDNTLTEVQRLRVEGRKLNQQLSLSI